MTGLKTKTRQTKRPFKNMRAECLNPKSKTLYCKTSITADQ